MDITYPNNLQQAGQEIRLRRRK